MDSNDNLIPILGEDMGEGFKDPADDPEYVKLMDKLAEQHERDKAHRKVKTSDLFPNRRISRPRFMRTR